jgi:5'(3')-deoxyribonucleotidase
MASRRKTIAVDIDDVLSATVEGVVEFANKRWKMNIKPDDYTEEWAVFFNLPIDETIRRIQVIVDSGVYGHHRHLDHTLPVLTALKRHYNLVAVTSRRSVLKPETDGWLAERFPGIFTDVRYAGFWDGEHDILTALSRTKAELCKELGAEYLIDDQIKHCVGAAQAGVKALLFGRYAWNRTGRTLPKNIVRVADWKEVEGYFRAKS